MLKSQSKICHKVTLDCGCYEVWDKQWVKRHIRCQWCDAHNNGTSTPNDERRLIYIHFNLVAEAAREQLADEERLDRVIPSDFHFVFTTFDAEM